MICNEKGNRKNYLHWLYVSSVSCASSYFLHLMCILFSENRRSSSSIQGEEHGGGSNTFQKRIVSSAAADTTVDPSGLFTTKEHRDQELAETSLAYVKRNATVFLWSFLTWESCKILSVCSVKSVIFAKEGYAHKLSRFWL